MATALGPSASPYQRTRISPKCQRLPVVFVARSSQTPVLGPAFGTREDAQDHFCARPSVPGKAIAARNTRARADSSPTPRSPRAPPTKDEQHHRHQPHRHNSDPRVPPRSLRRRYPRPHHLVGITHLPRPLETRPEPVTLIDHGGRARSAHARAALRGMGRPVHDRAAEERPLRARSVLPRHQPSAGDDARHADEETEREQHECDDESLPRNPSTASEGPSVVRHQTCLTHHRATRSVP